MGKNYEWIKKLPDEYEKVKNELYEMPAKSDNKIIKNAYMHTEMAGGSGVKSDEECSFKTIRQHTDELILRAEKLKEYGYINEEIFRLLYLSCEYHDMGKANSEFCKRIKNGGKFNIQKEVVHNILSMFMMPKCEYLTDGERDFYIIMFAVLTHHDYVDDIFGDFFLQTENMEKIKKFLEPHFNIFDETRLKNIRRLTKRMIKYQEENETILVKGLLHKCDYSASGDYEIEYPNDFLELCMDNLLKNWKEKQKTYMSTVYQEKSNWSDEGQKTEEIDWNEMQLFCRENREKNVVVVAPTGMGKTEGSLLWIGNNKGFYILPIRTAINAMYERIKGDVLKDKEFEYRLSILHSNTLEVYLENKDKKEIDVIDYSVRGKNLSMPLTISTLDQLFDFVYKYQGYELKLATFSYSKIVIDEIQMYEPELLAYIIYGIKRIAELGGKIAIVTATLPPYIYDELKADGVKTKGLHFEYKEFQSNLMRHNVKVKNEKINAEDICEKYMENKKADIPNKILVICNCVKTAQSIYQELTGKLEGEKVHLLHSKFMRKDRNRKESEIKKCGQNYDTENVIWVSTSLVEASLDIDFDYLFTELQDLTSLLQRMGRCNRKAFKLVDKTNVYIYTEIDKHLLKKQKNENHGFIDEKIYELSKKALMDLEIGFTGVVTEQQKIELLKKYFTTENLKGSPFWDAYKNAYETLEINRIYEIDKEDINFRNINSIDIIPHSVFIENKKEIMECEQIMKNKNISNEDIKMKEMEIKKYVVSVYRWEYKEYEKAFYEGKTYNNDVHYKVRINDYEQIPVMECDYDESIGYTRINFKDRKVEALMW